MRYTKIKKKRSLVKDSQSREKADMYTNCYVGKVLEQAQEMVRRAWGRGFGNTENGSTRRVRELIF